MLDTPAQVAYLTGPLGGGDGTEDRWDLRDYGCVGGPDAGDRAREPRQEGPLRVRSGDWWARLRLHQRACPGIDKAVRRVVNPAQAATVIRIFEMTAAGYGLSRVARN